MEDTMDRAYLTSEELSHIPSMVPEAVPVTPGIYWCPSNQGKKINLILVVSNGIAGTLREVIIVKDEVERQQRFDEDQKSVVRSVTATADQRMADLAPQYFAELMTQFVLKTDLTSRQKIRRKIKGLLDIFSADTVYPKGHDDLAVRRPDQLGRFGQGMGQMPPMFGGQDRQAAPADDLAEPPPPPLGALPAPGAGVAADLQMRV
jgi:hypothetical protein